MTIDLDLPPVWRGANPAGMVGGTRGMGSGMAGKPNRNRKRVTAKPSTLHES